MALIYRNVKSGKVVTMPEATEVKTRRQKRTAERTIQKLDVSHRWVRMSDSDEVAAAQAAWEEGRRAKTRTRPVSPTPVYVVNTTPEPEPDEPTNEIRHSGGPWFEVIVDGETVDKVNGREAAEARLAELTSGEGW
jgi:hypothetical protein